MSLIKPINIVTFGDVHMRHKRNSTESICQQVLAIFEDEKKTAELDIIFIEGDIFDNRIELSDEAVPIIDITFSKLFRLAKKYNIVIILLEGTPSHDWKQAQRLIALNEEVGEIYADVRYARNLSIEYIEHLGINILCVPDEWNMSTDKTLEEVKELMAAKGLTQVDFSLMHGNFRYQLPGHLTKVPCHSEQEYLALTKYLVMIGHNHTRTQYDRIYATGSLDRLSHGQEEDKGHYRFTVEPSGKYTAEFVVNKLARVYNTIHIVNDDIPVVLEEIKAKINDYPAQSCVRVSARYDHPIFSNMSQLTALAPDFVWSKLPIAEDETLIDTQEETEEELLYSPITITKENILQLLTDRLDKKCIDPALSEGTITLVRSVL